MRITKNTIASIIRNGGATINKFSERVTLKSGYQVSKQDLYILPLSEFTKHILINCIQLLTTRGEYLGVWIDNNLVYIDISKRYATKAAAEEAGRALNQLSILRWRDMECIYIRED